MMAKSKKQRRREAQARRDKRNLRRALIVLGSVIVAFVLSVVATGALVDELPPDSPSEDSPAVTIPNYDHTRVDRIAAELDKSPVAVHPMMRTLVDKHRQAEIARKIKTLNKPIDVVVTPENDYDESRGDMELMAGRIAAKTGLDGVVVVATGDDIYTVTNNVALTSASFIESDAKDAVRRRSDAQEAPVADVLSEMVTLIAHKDWMQGPPADVSEPSDGAPDVESRAMLAGFPVSGYVAGLIIGLLVGGGLLAIAIPIDIAVTGGSRAKAVTTPRKDTRA